MLRRIHTIEEDAREQLRELDRQTAATTIEPMLAQLLEKYRADCSEVVDYLEEMRADIIAQVDQFRAE